MNKLENSSDYSDVSPVPYFVTYALNGNVKCGIVELLDKSNAKTVIVNKFNLPTTINILEIKKVCDL